MCTAMIHRETDEFHYLHRGCVCILFALFVNVSSLFELFLTARRGPFCTAITLAME